jgi:hypothetical protein
VAPAGLREVHAAPPRSPDLSGLPLSFVPNEGQLDPEVKFVARGPGYQALLTEAGAVLSLCGREDLELRFRSSARPSVIEGLDPLPGVVNLYRGSDRARWRRGLPTFARVQYRSVYPGIDAVFYGNPRQLEFDIVVAPGADPSVIRLGVEGGELSLDERGDLSVQTALGPIVLSRPVVYQERDSERRIVAGRYVLAPSGEVAFELEGYDPTLPLVIDPTLLLPLPTMGDGRLTISSYLPAGDDVIVIGGDVDDAGNFFLVGSTRADDVGTDTPPHPGRAAGEDIVVVKVDAAGSAVLWSTYLGGENRDAAGGIALAANGSVFVAATSNSPDFPIAGDPVQPLKSALDDAVIVNLGPGGELQGSTFFGGSGSDLASGVAIDRDGDVYIAGATTLGNFPVTAGAFQTTFGGAIDGYVVKLSPGVDTVQYSTLLGGVSVDSPTGIDVGDDGSAHITGNSLSGNYPTRNPAQPTNQGSQDAFVTKLDPTGSNLIFSTFLGGSGSDRALALKVDPATGNAMVGGDTRSAAPFPRDGVVPDSAPDQTDGFFARYDPNGLLTFLAAAGGTGPDSLNAVDVDPATGEILVGGSTASTDVTLVDSIQPGLNSTGMGVEPFPGTDVLTGGYVETARANDTFPVAVIAARIDGDEQRDTVYLFDGPPGAPGVRIFDGVAGVDQVVEVTVNGGTDVAALPGDLPNQNDLVVAGSGGLLALSGIAGGGGPRVAVFPGTAGIPFHRVVTGIVDATGGELVVAARQVGDGPDSEVIVHLDGSPVRVFRLSGPTTDLALDTSRDPQLLAVATRTSVSLFEGDASLQSFTFPPASLRGLTLGDFNGDGVLDLFVTAPSSSRMLRGAGAGTFQISPQTFPTGPAPRLPVNDDFDGDDRVDVSFLGSDGTLVTLMNRTPPGSTEAIFAATSKRAGSFASAARSAAVIPREGSTPSLALAGVVGNDLWYGRWDAQDPSNVLQQGILGSTGLDELSDAFLGSDGAGNSSVSFIGQTRQRAPAGGFDLQSPFVLAFDRTADPRLPALSMDDASVLESDIFGLLAFMVTLSEPSDRDVSFGFTLIDVSAQAPLDYENISGTATIPAGATSTTIFVPVREDVLHEGDETLLVALSDPQGATIAVGEATGTIMDNDPPPSVSISDVSAGEGDAGSAAVDVTVTLDVASGLPASVDFATADGTATAGEDYLPLSGTLTFEPGQTTGTIQMIYNGDTLFEPDETVTLTLTNPVNAVIAVNRGTVTFFNDDPHPNVSITDASVDEGDAGTRIVVVPVTLGAPSGLPASVDFATADGTATAGEDYLPAAGTITFEPGQTTGTIQLIYNGDILFEPDETVTLTLTNPVNATIAVNRGTVTFFNDDVRFQPTVAAQVQTPVVNEGAPAQMLVTATADPNDAVFTITANYGDGTIQTVTIPLSGGAGTATISHVYSDNGVFQGTLQGIDAAGQTASTGFTITVNNVAPAVDAGPDQTFVPGQPVTVRGTIQDPGANDTFTVEIDWDGDGTFDESLTRPAGSTTFTAAHVYDATGATATFRVIDDDGGVGTDAVTFTGEAPTSELFYVDPLERTRTVLPFQPSGLSVVRIASAQTLFLLARRLCDLGLTPACTVAAQALAALDFFVPEDARYILRAPGGSAAAVAATLTSRDANGSPLQSHDVDLAPAGGGSIDSDPFVLVPTGSRIFSGSFGPLLFVSAEAQGSLLAEAPAFGESLASVCSPFLLTAKRPLGSLVYDPLVAGSIEAPGDEDCFGVLLDPGQTLTVQVRPDDASLQPRVEVNDPDGEPLSAASAPAAGQRSTLQTVAIAEPGTYRIDIDAIAGTLGPYRVRFVLNAAQEVETADGENDSIATAQDISGSFSSLFGDADRGAVLGVTDDVDFFQFSLPAGGRATLALADLAGDLPTREVELDLFDAGGNFLASSSSGGNVDRRISNFIAPASGTYYAQVTGDPGVPYNLIVSRNAAFDVEQRQGQAVVSLDETGVAWGFLGGRTTAGARDPYSLNLADGQVVHAFTRTPADGLGQFVNALNPRLQLRNGSGQVVANAAVLADGRNEELTFSVPVGGGGPYTLMLTAEEGTTGEYLLVVR